MQDRLNWFAIWLGTTGFALIALPLMLKWRYLRSQFNMWLIGSSADVTWRVMLPDGVFMYSLVAGTAILLIAIMLGYLSKR